MLCPDCVRAPGNWGSGWAAGAIASSSCSGRRETLVRLRADPRCALTILADEVACTAHAPATLVEEPMEVADNVAAVDLRVHEVQDHLQPTFASEGGVRWGRNAETARERGAAIQAALRELAARG